ncbi:ATP/GTP-binding protein [Mesomycoplasma conjunctivae]|uniref:Uncharacterized protein n=1 Tax=Mesomycoplasma conjunctivae (strain ATCC 25834 / NCTC 10147 / HRC/581) TaxID=572263 RepID=C5J7B3_MESCH|nr:tRNA (adenosine(37)-N6)-threonylcarbamoyltransferase complex ATPase subunit type 1 TsaE [Mesomycoplasma conjunctivae]CAT05376.1 HYPOTHETICAL PROTEIN MCJ_006820 [Mesomycoplasma conjunctivae]VEU66602.1 ATP/GTP-binding protein [Mesomycoplasma conjunctivae]
MNVKANYQYYQNLKSKSASDLDFIILKILELKVQFIYLVGDYGSGKTFFVKQLGKHLKIKDEITSPSFNFAFVYKGLVHIDLDNYKGDLSEFEDYFIDNIVAIEWADKLNFFDQNSVLIEIKIWDEFTRDINFYYN